MSSGTTIWASVGGAGRRIEKPVWALSEQMARMTVVGAIGAVVAVRVARTTRAGRTHARSWQDTGPLTGQDQAQECAVLVAIDLAVPLANHNHIQRRDYVHAALACPQGREQIGAPVVVYPTAL